MKKYIVAVLVNVLLLSSISLSVPAECGSSSTEGHSLAQSGELSAQTELSPLEILILDIRDVIGLIERGDNKTAIIILKSANKEVRKVKEFDANTKKVTSKRIKKGIQLLKQNKNDEALALLQTGIDQLVEAGFAVPEDFE